MAIYILFAFVLGVVGTLIGVQYYPDILVPTKTVQEEVMVLAQSPTPERVVATTTIAEGDQISVYEGIAVSEMSQVLDLSGRKLTGSLKAEIRLLPMLQVLDLNGNQFTGLPAEIGQLSELRILNLSNNDLTGLPHELGNLQKLTLLDVRGNTVSSADMEIIVAKLPATTEVLR